MGSYEYLERLEGKIRDGIFFCVNKSDNYSVTKEFFDPCFMFGRNSIDFITQVDIYFILGLHIHLFENKFLRDINNMLD